MTYSHIAYIDEAGDEGFGKLKKQERSGQSQWLLLGAAIVREDCDRSLPTWRNEILDRFPKSKKQNLHFRDLKHEQKVVACQEIGKRPVRSCVTFSNKLTIANSQCANTFKRPGYLYNYLVRWLLERVSSFCVQDAIINNIQKPKLKVVFSRRGGTDYQKMKEYMGYIRAGNESYSPARSIRWEIFGPENIVVENHNKWAGLQFADVITSAYFCAVEPNFYGNYETRYADLLRHTVIHKNGNALNEGITPVPSLWKCEANALQSEFFKSFLNLKK